MAKVAKCESVTQGQSKITPLKEFTFDYAATISAGVWRAFVNANLAMVRGRRLYYHVMDMNAGCGWNDAAQCDGSPIVMLRRFSMLPAKFYFCDINKKAIGKLQEVVRDQFPDQFEKCQFWNMDNAEAPGRYVSELARQERNLGLAMGHILSDPNGNVNGANYAAIAKAIKGIPRVDLFLNFNHGAYLRTSACGVCTRDKHKWDLCAICEMMGKTHWLVRRPLVKQGSKFIIAIGRNYATSAARTSGWFNLRSVVGQQIASDAPRMLEEQGMLFANVEVLE